MNSLAYVTAVLGTLLISLCLFYILQVIAYWKVFAKAGQPGWKSLIPLYNIYIQYKISWKPVMLFVLLACVIASRLLLSEDGTANPAGIVLDLAAVVINVMACIKLSRAFGHGIGFALGLFFLPPIFMMILGLGSSTYEGPQ